MTTRTAKTIALADVYAAQPDWFSCEKKQFFGDKGYWLLRGKRSRRTYLIRSTYAWSDAFGKPRRLHYRINPLSEALKIEPLVEEIFPSLAAVRAWLASH